MDLNLTLYSDPTRVLIFRSSGQRPGHFGEKTLTKKLETLNDFKETFPEGSSTPCAHFQLIMSKVNVTLKKSLTKAFTTKITMQALCTLRFSLSKHYALK